MRYLLVGLIVSLLAWGIAFADDAPADQDNGDNGQAAAQAPAQPDFAVPDPAKHGPSGIPIYDGPSYSSLDSNQTDVNNIPREFHAFQHRPVDEVGYSPLTLE